MAPKRKITNDSSFSRKRPSRVATLPLENHPEAASLPVGEPIQSPPGSTSPPPFSPPNVNDFPADPLIERIQSAIDYTSAQNAAGQPALQTTRFTLPFSHPGLFLLRQAHAIDLAFLVYKSDTHECYEIGIPRPNWVAEGVPPGVHDPQWWVGKSSVEIKAGPWADEEGLRHAGAILKSQKTRGRNEEKKHLKETGDKRSKKQIEIEDKLMEGLRRQKAGESMCDDTDYEADDSEWGSEEDIDEEECQELEVGEWRQEANSTSDNEDELLVGGKVALDDLDDDGDSEDDNPLLRDPRYLAFVRKKVQDSIDEDSEDGLPIRRGVRNRARNSF